MNVEAAGVALLARVAGGVAGDAAGASPRWSNAGCGCWCRGWCAGPRGEGGAADEPGPVYALRQGSLQRLVREMTAGADLGMKTAGSEFRSRGLQRVVYKRVVYSRRCVLLYGLGLRGV